MIEMQAKCRGKRCGRVILMTNRFDETKGPHPYDLPTKCEACKGEGQVRELDIQGDMFADVNDRPRLVLVDCRKCKGRGKVYVSHYQTCPNAEYFRQRAKEKRHAQTNG